MRTDSMESLRYRRSWWAALTLPLPLAALAVYVLFEWIFFVTKPSVLSTLSWPDRLAVLVQTPAPFIPFVLAAQAVATLVAIVAFRHLRGIAVIPTGLLLGCLALLLIDNFTHVLFGFSSTNVDLRLRYVYAGILLILVAVVSRRLYQWLDALDVPGGRTARRAAIAIALIALPSFVTFVIAEVKRPRVGNLFSVAPAPSRSGNLPNVLFLTNDSVESRYLSAYGFPQPSTPFLDSLRDETLFCENAFSNACRTYGSLVTILTGKLPTTTHVLDPPSIVYDEARFEHLPGILRGHGYRTLQISTKLHGDAATANLVGAFDLANYDWETLRFDRVDRATDTARVFRLQVFDRLQDRLTRTFAGEDKDTFAFVMGTHRPAFWSDERRIRTLLRFMSETREPWFAHVHLLDTHRGKDPVVAVRGADDWMRMAVDALRKSGQFERTIVVIGSDHGRWWQTRERLPLMIRFPHGAHARREPQNVQTADIAPTILEAMGLPIPPWMDGQSLLRPAPANRPIVALCGVSGAARRPYQPEKLRLPNYGTESATIVSGSWWYEMRIADGRLRSGPVTGHTSPRPQTPPAVALGELRQKLAEAGFRLP